MCGVLGAPRSTYYWAISHPGPERTDAPPLAGDVVRIYEDRRREYGAPKIKRALAREGIVASKRRIKRMERRRLHGRGRPLHPLVQQAADQGIARGDEPAAAQAVAQSSGMSALVRKNVNIPKGGADE